MNTLECFLHAEGLRKTGKLEECRQFMDEKVKSKEMRTSDRSVVLDRIAADESVSAKEIQR